MAIRPRIRFRAIDRALVLQLVGVVALGFATAYAAWLVITFAFDRFGW